MDDVASAPPAQGRDALLTGVGRILISQQEIQERVAQLGAQISRDYEGRNPLLVGVLKGVIFFMTDLLRAITIPVGLDFMAISRYDPQHQAAGSVRLVKDLEEPLDGRHLVFVEDMIDTGLTLSYLLRLLQARGPASLEVCALFNKPQHRLVKIPIKYQGFDLPDRFVVGYGLDYREDYRHLPFVAELKPEVLKLGG
jgi:hypoxanthine phosphoribosyltransferase